MAKPKTYGIIAEYDPFHNGHGYLVRRARACGAETVVAVMSGAVTQRGELACFDKAARVRAALQSGVDLCVELPVPWACAPAGQFALGGVSLLGALGVEAVIFGSESGDLAALERGAAAVAQADGEAVRAAVKRGSTYADALNSCLPAEATALMQNPNDLLGMEYINAANALGLPLTFVAEKRVGAAHDSDEAAGGIASASRIRGLARAGEDYAGYLPDGTAALYASAPCADTALAERTLLHLLRGMTADRLALIDGVTEGLENRILRAAAQATSFTEAAELIKTKRYTLARVRRVLLRCLIGIEREGLPDLPPYIRVLGLTPRGAALLHGVKRGFPVLTKPADCDALDGSGRRVFALEVKASELRALALPPAPAGGELRYTPVFLQAPDGAAQ